MSGEEVNNTGLIEPGAVLANTREALGVTQREVSDALNLPVTIVDAIERGDKSLLPAHVFARGYVRAYAKLLELDPEPLVAAMTADQPAEEVDQNPEPAASGMRSPLIGLGAKIRLEPKVMVTALGALVLAVLLLWFIFSEDEPAVESDVNASSLSTPGDEKTMALLDEPVPPPSDIDQAVATMPAEDADSIATNAIEPAEVLAAQEELQSPPTEQSVLVAAGSVQPVEGESATTALGNNDRRLTATGDDRLSLEFTEESWVEIKDGQGKTLYGDLGRMGQTLNFVGAGPFRVVLGYAPGVLLKFNSEPVALSPHTRNNVASLVLGQ